MNAYIIIDYTNDFVAADGKLTAGEPAQAIDAALCQGLKTAMVRGDLIFVLNDLHYQKDSSHPESALFPPHNVLGTAGREVYGQTGRTLKEHLDLNNTQIFWLDKLRYSGFKGTPLDLLLRQRGISTLEITGVCTDICVLHTAIDAYNLGYKVKINAGRVASFDAGGHRWALNHIATTLGFTVEEEEK